MSTARSGVRRRMLISGNWKMHHDHLQAIRTIQDLGLRIKSDDVSILDVTVHPPFTDLRSVSTVLEDRSIPVQLGAQHCHQLDTGAFTGEISPPMLARLGVSHVIVGHSERRQLFGQTDEQVALILRAVVKHGMTPILCVGETEEERLSGETEDKISGQVLAAVKGLAVDVAAGLVIAYEPIWAIGTGQSATAEDAQAACAHIRSTLAGLYSSKSDSEMVAAGLRVQYGGSVKPDGAAELAMQSDVDGLLVGGASLDAAGFEEIITAAAGVARRSR